MNYNYEIMMNIKLAVFSNYPINWSQESAIGLIDQNKKILAIVTMALAIVVACFAIARYCLPKKVVKNDAENLKAPSLNDTSSKKELLEAVSPAKQKEEEKPAVTEKLQESTEKNEQVVPIADEKPKKTGLELTKSLVEDAEEAIKRIDARLADGQDLSQDLKSKYLAQREGQLKKKELMLQLLELDNLDISRLQSEAAEIEQKLHKQQTSLDDLIKKIAEENEKIKPKEKEIEEIQTEINRLSEGKHEKVICSEGDISIRQVWWDLPIENEDEKKEEIRKREDAILQLKLLVTSRTSKLDRTPLQILEKQKTCFEEEIGRLNEFLARTQARINEKKGTSQLTAC